MKAHSPDLLEDYQLALRKYLDGAGEAALKEAHELGRRGLAQGLGVLEMVALQHEALAELVQKSHPGQSCADIVRAVQDFAVENLSVFEMTHRGFRESNTTLRRLNEKLNEKMEEGAKQVAHVLHDEAGQLLAVVNMALHQALHEFPPDVQARFSQVRELLRQVEEQLRRLSHELRPMMLDELGIVPALQFLARGTSERTGIPVVVEGKTDGRLTPSIETTLYRTVQEALTNMAKHAQARRARVQISREPKIIRCSVRDDGIGFDVAAVLTKRGDHGLGLIGMQERLASLGGTLHINSAPQQGTEIVMTVPFEP